MIDEIQKYFQEALTAIRLSEEHLSPRLCQAVEMICQAVKAGGESAVECASTMRPVERLVAVR